MSNRKAYRIKLTAEERDTFSQVGKGKRGKLKIAAWKVQRANAMLMCDEGDDGPGLTDERIAEALATTTRSLENWRKQAALQGPLSLLERKQRATPPTPRILDGEKEAQLTKIACSTPPNGRSRWTLQMLADELVALEIVDSISADTVGRVQKKRVEAVAQIDVVHSAGARCGVCRCDGAGFDRVSPPLRPALSGC
jgi:bacterioferritin-associated ferredoxin